MLCNLQIQSYGGKTMTTKECIKKLVFEQWRLTISEDHICKFPDDDCPGHMGLGHWDVYGARCGEFTVLVYVYDNGEIRLHMV